jgi:hypothetical protein
LQRLTFMRADDRRGAFRTRPALGCGPGAWVTLWTGSLGNSPR